MQRTERPWGWYDNLVADQGYLVKRLWIAPDQRLSLQRHRHRQEHWVVTAGAGVVHIDGIDHPAAAGSSFHVPCEAVHRATASDQGLLSWRFSGAAFSARTTLNASLMITDGFNPLQDDRFRSLKFSL